MLVLYNIFISSGAAGLSTSLLISIELPALGHCTQLVFRVKPSRRGHIVENMEDLVEAMLSEWQEDIQDADMEATARHLETFRRRACADLEEWQARFKLVEEWKLKVDTSKRQLNEMRDAYYKELFHLREQVYQREEAAKQGEKFEATYALHFDPSKFTFDDDVAKLVEENVALVRQEFETKMRQYYTILLYDILS